MVQMCSSHIALIITSHLRVHSQRIIPKCSVLRKITIFSLNKRASLICVFVAGGISGKEPHGPSLQMHKTSCPTRFKGHTPIAVFLLLN